MKNNLKFWQVDSFTTKPFKGNPAAVFVLYEELEDQLLQDIALEMNLSETAFILIRNNHLPLLRWFTPTCEIDLCGHATLAAAHIYLTELYSNLTEVTFNTKFVGNLSVELNGLQYKMNFPSRLGEKKDIKMISNDVLEGLGTAASPFEIYEARDLMLVYENDHLIYNMKPDFQRLAKYDKFIIVTALSSEKKYDFVSRFFCAGIGIPEDPVTGSAHCTLTPYWAGRLNKNCMTAYQASKRGGELSLELAGERVFISGNAVTLIEGNMKI